MVSHAMSTHARPMFVFHIHGQILLTLKCITDIRHRFINSGTNEGPDSPIEITLGLFYITPRCPIYVGEGDISNVQVSITKIYHFSSGP